MKVTGSNPVMPIRENKESGQGNAHECVSHAIQQHCGHGDSQRIFGAFAVDKSRECEYNITVSLAGADYIAKR